MLNTVQQTILERLREEGQLISTHNTLTRILDSLVMEGKAKKEGNIYIPAQRPFQKGQKVTFVYKGRKLTGEVVKINEESVRIVYHNEIGQTEDATIRNDKVN